MRNPTWCVNPTYFCAQRLRTTDWVIFHCLNTLSVSTEYETGGCSVQNAEEYHNTMNFFLFAALDPRTLTRAEAHDYARRAFDLGINYIGGCCGFEPMHIRSIAQEVSVLDAF